MSDPKHPTGPRKGAGFTIPAAADEIPVAYRTLLQAVKAGQVEVIEFGGLKRISRAEVKRVRTLLFGEDAV
jgi:hypothetical protein